MDTTLLTKLNEWAGTKGIDYLSEDTGLSACFKCLCSGLDNYCVSFEPAGKNTYCYLTIYGEPALEGGDEVRASYEFMAETPALALCKVIEKFIDGSEK